ncbi:kinase-like domain-containing protein [Aspergillus carlsbadensis]|nr:kinase-like domain-containing protein [Aspergillus carlsbadensis]
MDKQTVNADKASPDAQKAEAEALTKINALLLNDISTKIKSYPSMDMTAILEQKLKTYPTLRQVFTKSALKAASSSTARAEPPRPPADPRDEFRIPLDAKVLRPLDAAVLQTAQVQVQDTQDASDLSLVLARLNDRVQESEVIWQLGSSAVLGLDSRLVMKVGQDIDISHIPTLDYVKQQAPRLPIPEIHGVVQQADGNRTFVFMTRIAGEPLDSKWRSLDRIQKASISEQLDTIMRGFRLLPAPPSDDPRAVLGGGNPRRCKDARRQLRTADEPITNESTFNEFIASNPQRSNSSYIEMIRSYLESDHEIVLTHGDLHPRNIMVSITPGDSSDDAPRVVVTGLLDWEMAGWYPEYWEYVKALHTLAPGDGFDDWYVYLPPAIGVWPREHAVDVMLSRWHG